MGILLRGFRAPPQPVKAKRKPVQLKEVHLAKPVAEWLRAKGYLEVYAEIGRGPCDLVGWDPQKERLVCVELKRCLSWKVLKQSALHQLATEYVYAAVESTPRAKSLSTAAHYGIGVLCIREGRVAEIMAPEKRIDPHDGYRRELLDVIEVSEPSDNGGLPNLAGEGPAHECAKRVRRYIQTHPGCTWKEIYIAVLNQYSSHHSLSQVMNRRFGITTT